MKLDKKRFVTLVLILTMSFSTLASIPTYAHSAILNIHYDNCQGVEQDDGEDEMWYVLQKGSVS